MKTITSITKAALSEMQNRSNPLLAPGARQRSEMNAFLSRTGGVADFMKAYGPGAWAQIAAAPDAALTADEPTMRRIDSIYGRGTTANLVQAALSALYFSSSRADGAAAPAIADYAPTLAVELLGLRPSELCLFFHRFKAGQIGRGYASFELRHVGMALQEFMRWRVAALAGAEARAATTHRADAAPQAALHNPRERFRWPRYVVRMLTQNAESRRRMEWRFGLAPLDGGDEAAQCRPGEPLLISGYLSPQSRGLLEECERRGLVEVVCVRTKSPGFGFGNEAERG